MTREFSPRASGAFLTPDPASDTLTFPVTPVWTQQHPPQRGLGVLVPWREVPPKTTSIERLFRIPGRQASLWLPGEQVRGAKGRNGSGGPIYLEATPWRADTGDSFPQRCCGGEGW